MGDAGGELADGGQLLGAEHLALALLQALDHVLDLSDQGLVLFVQSLQVPSLSLGPITIDLASINFTNYQYLLYGLALVAMMLLRPEGLFPSRRRRRELREFTDEAAEFQAETAIEATQI